MDKALAARAEELTDVNIRGGILTRRPAIFDVPDVAEHFTWNSWHMSGIERKAVKEGFAYYIPLRYSELPGYYRNCIKTLDVAMFQVAPMDEHGWFNFGPGGSHPKRSVSAPRPSSWRSTKTFRFVWAVLKTASIFAM